MNWKIRGNYKQKKREGYNLLNNNSQFFPTLPGLTFDFKEDGSIVCQGTSSATWNRKRNAGNIYNVESGTYTLYLKVIGSCPNAILSIALEDADMKTLTSSRIGVSNSSLIKVGTFTYDATTEIKYTSIVLEGFKTDSSYDCIFYPMLMKNTYTADVAYEQYGASPSPEFSSAIETVSGDVKVKAGNKQLFNKNNYQKFMGGMWSEKLWANNDNRCVYIQAEENTSYSISRIAGARFTVAFVDELPDGEKGATLYDAQSSDGTKIIITNTNHKYLFVYYYTTIVAEDELAILNSLQIEKGKMVTEYEEHKSQVITMPIQQEMLEGDYVADVEHHEWGKIILTGEEKLIDNVSTSIRTYWGIDFSNYGIYQYNDPTRICDVLTTKFKSRPQQGTFLPGQVALITSNKNMYFVFEPDTTEEQARAILKDMPVYFRLATPFDLELTEEQKAVREQKMYTYKNITNISVSDELSSIDVEYKKDIETIEKNIESRLAALETASTSEEAE